MHSFSDFKIRQHSNLRKKIGDENGTSLASSKLNCLSCAHAGSVSMATTFKSKSTAQTRIFLVEDHAMVREGLAEAIKREPDLMVCGESDEAGKAAQLIQQSRP